MAGRLIILNGPSSAGKTTLGRALQVALPDPFLFFSLDFFLFGDVLPRTPQGELRDWAKLRPNVHDGFYRCLRALVEGGNDVIAELILEDRSQLARLAEQVDDLAVFWVGLHVDVGELERRERARGDRRIGDARRDAATVHTFRTYDIEVDAGGSLDVNVSTVVEAWQQRQT